MVLNTNDFPSPLNRIPILTRNLNPHITQKPTTIQSYPSPLIRTHGCDPPLLPLVERLQTLDPQALRILQAGLWQSPSSGSPTMRGDESRAGTQPAAFPSIPSLSNGKNNSMRSQSRFWRSKIMRLYLFVSLFLSSPQETENLLRKDLSPKAFFFCLLGRPSCPWHPYERPRTPTSREGSSQTLERTDRRPLLCGSVGGQNPLLTSSLREVATWRLWSGRDPLTTWRLMFWSELCRIFTWLGSSYIYIFWVR